PAAWGTAARTADPPADQHGAAAALGAGAAVGRIPAGPQDADRRRRSLFERDAAPLARRPQRAQRRSADRGQRVHHHVLLRAAGLRAADRSPAAQYPHLCAGPSVRAGAAGGGGRAVHRRPRPCARPCGPRGEADYVPPRKPVETVLAGLFAELLGLARVGINDNFFELGGDSIQCIQLVARARAKDVAITPQQIFQYQTVAALAEAADRTEARVEEDTQPGPSPLTPIQHWFFERPGPIEHFNQAVLLEIPA